MSSLKVGWVTVLLAVAVGVMGTLLVVRQGDTLSPTAYGQVSPGVIAGNALGMLGQPYNNMVPLFLVDTKSQTILIYEFNQSNRKLYLRIARSFSADRELQDNGWGERDQYSGPSVKDVQNMLRGK